ncbi:cell division protein FtsL [Hahella sp. SMD15-11]|uniref:Cell division protein FtsL n=1 Tax=Thermohahella caldifontis TaxID=3142973 RepID=A0AB39UWI3_9GAMM
MMIRHQPVGATRKQPRTSAVQAVRIRTGAGVETFRNWMQETRQLIGRLLRGKNLVTAGLAALVVVSCFGVIYSASLNRGLYRTLDKLEQERARLDKEWVQLLLEESSWGAPSRIESIAVNKLHMVQPAAREIVLVRKPR